TKDGAGRVAAHEIMIGTPAIRNLIRENKIAQMYSAIQTGRNIGMQTLDQNLQELVQKSVVSSGEARGKAANKALFAKKGSDLFLTHGFPPAMKVDGKISPVSQTPLTNQHAGMLARSIMNDK